MSDRPGRYLERRRNSVAIVFFAGLGVALMLSLMAFVHPLFLVPCVPLIAFLWRYSSAGRWLDPDSWIKGLRGERAVGQVLEQLPSAYEVVHDLDVGRGNVDHVVIGPTGVFAIETKHRKGKFYVRGGRLFFKGREDEATRKQAVRGAIEVRQRLEAAGFRRLRVDALIVSTNALVWNGELDLRYARVLDVNALVPHIERARQRLSAEQVARAAEALRHSRSQPT